MTDGKLTAREMEILHHVSEGKCDKEVAGELGISLHTEHVHMKNIRRKLNVPSRWMAAKWYEKHCKPAGRG